MVNIHLRDFDLQMSRAEQIAQSSKQDQVIYKSTDSQRYEIFLITPKEGFAGNAFRTVRYAGKAINEAVLQDSGIERPNVVNKTTEPEKKGLVVGQMGKASDKADISTKKSGSNKHKAT
jgi:hypothetical protein